MITEIYPLIGKQSLCISSVVTRTIYFGTAEAPSFSPYNCINESDRIQWVGIILWPIDAQKPAIVDANESPVCFMQDATRSQSTIQNHVRGAGPFKVRFPIKAYLSTDLGPT